MGENQTSDMKKRMLFGIGIAVALFGALFFSLRKENTVFVFRNEGNERRIPQETIEKKEKEVLVLTVSAWVPYWATEGGLRSLEGKEKNFSEIHPFAFEVQSDGTLEDRAKVTGVLWKKARVEMEQAGVRVVPTVLWGDAAAMHRVLGDERLRTKHVQNLLTMTSAYGFSGVDIDYEGKDVADKENFSKFLVELYSVFSENKKDVRCTVEARDRDDVPANLSGVRAMSYANDFSVLATACDEVRVMAYDQVFQVHRAKTFEEKGDKPYAPNADIAWVEGVMRYALRYIPAEKLMMGVPTYGWEFRVTPIEGGYRYERVRSVTYEQAMEMLRKTENGKQEMDLGTRNVGGERDFVYEAEDGKHLVNFSDAESMAQKLQLAKILGIKGVSIFKLDGFADPGIFEVIKSGK